MHTVTRFLDSVDKPTASQAAELYGQGWDGWAGNVFGDGVPASWLWTPADVAIVVRAGFAFLPIATVDWSLDQSGKDLAYGVVVAALQCGVVGAVAIDTEYQERGNAHLNPTVDGFVRRVAAMNWQPVVYAGAGYHGDGALWLPRWGLASGSAGPVPPMSAIPAGGAIQYAGGVTTAAGITVDLSVANGLPFGRSLPSVDIL